MNILFVVPYVPNLVRVRPYNLIRALSQRGHRVTVLTVWTDEAERADLAALQEQCHAVHALHMPRLKSFLNCALAIPTQRPFQSVYSWHPDLVAGLNGTSQFDVVHVEHLRGAQYGLFFKEHTRLPVVWDSVDCITHLFRQTVIHSEDRLRRLRSQLDLGRTEKYEGWLVNQFDHVLVTSPTDRQELLTLSRNGQEAAPITSVPNGVDMSYFRPDTAVARDPDTLVVSGKMSYHANIAMVMHLANEIMPLVWEKRPSTRLMVVGKDPTPEIQSLAENRAVTVTGTVADLPPYLQQAAVALAPITYSAGIQNKILEAMACQTPVITSARAVSTLPIEPGRDLLVADTPGAFAGQILSLLDDPEQRQQIGEAGYNYVKANHSWDSAAQTLERIYAGVAAAVTSGTAI